MVHESHMIHVTIEADGASVSAANAVGGWAESHPGDDHLIVQVVSANERVAIPDPSMWPATVASDPEALKALEAALGEHASNYQVTVTDGEQFVHAFGALSAKPGFVTWAEVRAGFRGFFLTKQLSWGQIVAAALLTAFLNRWFG